MPTELERALQRAANWEEHFVSQIEKPSVEHTSRESRIADRITAFAGSMTFVYLHCVWFGLWVLANTGLLVAMGLGLTPFDPFPFGFLTLVVSLEAIFLSTFVMIAQNRTSEIADKRAAADFEVNVLAEQEVAKLLHLVETLVAHEAARAAALADAEGH